MSELPQRRSADVDGGEAEISPAAAASYIADMCEGMASLARRLGLQRTASSLDQASRAAAIEIDSAA